MRKSLLFVLLLLLAAGCHAKLNQESTVQLVSIEPKQFKVDPIAKEQVINVSAKASDGTFHIFVFLEKDQATVEGSIVRNKPDESKVLKHKLKATEAELQATIPARETAVIYLVSADGKKAEVKLRISN